MASRFAPIVLGVLVGISCSLAPTNAYAENAEPTNEASAKSSTQTNTRTSMKNIRSAASRIRLTVLDLISDVTMRKMSDDEGDPIFFEPSEKQVQKDPSLYSKEIGNWGSMGNIEAPRKSWLDADMKHLEHWVMALNDDMSAVPTETQKLSADSWQKMQNVAQDINSSLMDLKSLTKGPNYENMAIAKAALKLNDQVKQLEEPWKTVMKALRAHKP